MNYWMVNGQQLNDEQYAEWRRQQRLEEQRIQEESDRLSRQLNQAYTALKEHLQRNPNVGQKITDERALEQQIYYNLRQNLHRADQAPRCVWIHEGGTVCKSPRMKNDIHCYSHYRMRQTRADNLCLPAQTDANAIQMAVMMVQRALIDDEISEKKAGLLLYSIQIAATNVGKTTFGQANAEMVTETRDEDEVMEEHKAQMEKLKMIEKAKTLPRINTDDTDPNSGEGLPRMDADERGPEKQNLPLMNTEDTDLKSGEKTSPRINTDETDLSGGPEKILPQSVGSGPEVYANRGQTAETHANLG